MKQKILNVFASHPKLTMLAVGAAITVAVGASLGLAAPHLAFAGGGHWGS